MGPNANWSTYKKKQLGQTHREARPHEDSLRRLSSQSQGENRRNQHCWHLAFQTPELKQSKSLSSVLPSVSKFILKALES